MEAMMRECPESVCDGTGMVWNDEKRCEEKCPCVKDEWAIEPTDA